MGLPRDEAESLMKSVEFGAIAAEASARSVAQFLLDLRRTGSGVMAKRGQCTRQAVHKRTTKINRELTARVTGWRDQESERSTDIGRGRIREGMYQMV